MVPVCAPPLGNSRQIRLWIIYNTLTRWEKSVTSNCCTSQMLISTFGAFGDTCQRETAESSSYGACLVFLGFGKSVFPNPPGIRWNGFDQCVDLGWLNVEKCTFAEMNRPGCLCSLSWINEEGGGVMQGGCGWASIDLALEELSYYSLKTSNERRGLDNRRVRPWKSTSWLNASRTSGVLVLCLVVLLPIFHWRETSFCFAFQFNPLMCAISSSLSSHLCPCPHFPAVYDSMTRASGSSVWRGPGWQADILNSDPLSTTNSAWQRRNRCTWYWSQSWNTLHYPRMDDICGKQQIIQHGDVIFIETQ